MQIESDFPTAQEIAKHVVSLVTRYQTLHDAQFSHSVRRLSFRKIDTDAGVGYGTIANFVKIADGHDHQSFYYSTAERLVRFLTECIQACEEMDRGAEGSVQSAHLESLLSRLRKKR